jgi:N-acetylneuraminic acid mutarotase
LSGQVCGGVDAGTNQCGGSASCGVVFLRDGGYAAPPAILPAPAFAFDGYATSGGSGINDFGQIVGAASVGSSAIPLYWSSPSTTPAALVTTNDAGVSLNSVLGAEAINNSGQIAGVGGSGFSDFPVCWASPASYPAVASGGSGRQIIGMNNLGQMVGSPTGDPNGLYWSSPTAAPVSLPSGPFSPPIAAASINDCGQIVGYGTLGGVTGPIYWANSASSPVAIPNGAFSSSAAAGINNGGQIVGFERSYAHALFWSSAAATPSALPAIDGGAQITAGGINSLGDVVGSAYDPVSTKQVSIRWARCHAETDAQFCARQTKNCGPLTAIDNCGAWRSVASCGACIAPQTCGGGGPAGLCGGGGCVPTHAVAPLPVARATLAAAAGPDGRIYAIAGQKAVGGPTNEVDAYNACTNTWTVVAPLPAVIGAVVATTGKDGRIYVLGGALPGFSATSAYAYDTTLNAWTTLAPMNTARQSAGAAGGLDGRIYVFGGAGPGPSYSALNSVEAYDPTTNTWTAMAPMPTARLQHAAVTGLDGRIYVMGGNNYGCFPYQNVDVYDPPSNTWSTVAPLPIPQDKLSAALGVDGRIYAISGATGGCSQSDTGTVNAYNIATNTWTAVAPIPTPRESSAAAATRGFIFVISGGGFNNPPIPGCASYDPIGNTW